MASLSPTPPLCGSCQDNFQFSERMHLEFSKLPPDLSRIEELVEEEFTEMQQHIMQKVEQIVKQNVKLEIKETVVRLQNENLKSDLKEEKGKNNSLKEKVKKLKTELSEKKEELANKQILTFEKILRFIFEKFAAFFSQKRDAMVHFWNHHGFQGDSLRHE